MGGGGFLGLGPAKSAPAPPDYTAAAQQTAQGNLDAVRAATAANRVNQYTPYGSLEYSQSGTDQYGNPTWSATTNLSDTGRALLNTQDQTSLGLGQTINAQLGQVQSTMGQGFNPNTANIVTNPNYASGMEGWDKANQILQARLQPQMEQSRERQETALVNQGIPVGSKAYENAMRTFDAGQNDLLTNSQLTGQRIGANLFDQGVAGGQFQNQAQKQQYEQAMANYNMPLNTLNALRSGAQVTNPTFSNNIPQQATTTGADYLGAAQMGYNAQMGDFNSKQAQQANLNAGIYGLGGAGMMKYSDIRVKENIKSLGYEYKGLPVYEFEYKPEFKQEAGHGKFVGVMAQDVEKVMPYAVITGSDGYKMVNYGVI
jgi:hypothetical protein